MDCYDVLAMFKDYESTYCATGMGGDKFDLSKLKPDELKKLERSGGGDDEGLANNIMEALQKNMPGDHKKIPLSTPAYRLHSSSPVAMSQDAHATPRSSQMKASCATTKDAASSYLANSCPRAAEETVKADESSKSVLWDSSLPPNVIIHAGATPTVPMPAHMTSGPAMRTFVRLLETMGAVALCAGGMAGMSTAVARMEAGECLNH
eukprot:gene4101-14202_t